MSVPYFHVDSFTIDDRPFTGNPAGVCVVPAMPSEDTMRLVAREMNLSETAFVCPHQTHPEEYQLRWFTPTTEVALCGHGTLAVSHVLLSEQVTGLSLPSSPQQLRFHTLSGVLMVTRSEEDKGVLCMDLPEGNPQDVSLSADLKEQLCRHLPLPSVQSIVNVAFCDKTKKLLVEVDSMDTVKQLKPSMDGLLSMDFKDLNVRGISVTTRYIVW